MHFSGCSGPFSRLDTNQTGLYGPGSPFHLLIHPSRVIPSSPDCYVHLGPHTPQGGTDVLDEPVGLTNIGLRMTILFVPAEAKEPETFSRSHEYIPPRTTIGCFSISTEPVEVRGIKRPYDGRHWGNEAFALGVLNINPEEDGARYPDRLYAILLQSAQASGTYTTYGNWKKCDTEQIITFKCHDKSNIVDPEVETSTRTKSRAERVHAKVCFRTVYL